MELQPKFGRVLIKREIKEKTKGGIILTEDTAKRHANHKGVIVALGETAGWVQVPENNELKYIRNIAVGDEVIFGKHAGTWLDPNFGELANDEGASYFMCADADILAVIKEAA